MAQVAAIVVAAGQGLRAGGELPEQYRSLSAQHPAPNTPCRVLASVPTDTSRTAGDTTRTTSLFRIADPGSNVLAAGIRQRHRQASVRAGLEALRRASPISC